MEIASCTARCHKPISSVDLHYFPWTVLIFALELTCERVLPDGGFFGLENKLPALGAVCRYVRPTSHERKHGVLAFDAFGQLGKSINRP